MKWRLYTVGKPALAYAKTGVAEYLKRLQRYTSCEHQVLRHGHWQEIAPWLDRSEGTLTLILDERGDALTTRAFAYKLEEWQLHAVKAIHVFIGGANGHPEEARQRADLVIRLSAFTLQHELALLVFLEQLYRAHTILRGEPYHRD